MSTYNDEKNETTVSKAIGDIDVINTSGHVQELNRTFGLWSVCGIAVVSDNAWAAGGGALVVALYNGGGPGVLYGLIAGTFFYCFIGACLAELSSSMPTSANVYHWASVTAGPRYGRTVSFFAGWWNCLAWVFGVAGPTAFAANAVIAIYALYNPDYAPERWQIFIVYLGILLIDSLLVLFGQRFLARASTVFGILCLLFVFISILVLVIMTSQNGIGFASNEFVWTDFQNLTGWESAGFVFLMGVLNGAFTVGTPDGVCHLAEEIPNPRVNIPWGIFAQLSTGFLSAFAFYIAVLYGINDLDAVYETNITSLPLAAAYQQATGSQAATAALLVIFVIDLIIAIPGAYLTAGRMLWTLARDDAVPFSPWVRRVSPKWQNPFNAQLVVSLFLVVLGAIYVGNATAFSAFVGVFCILTTASYCAAILPHAITGRRYAPKGPFYMPAPWAYIVMGIACSYIIVFNVIYMFPFVYPVTEETMNYASVMVGGCTILLVIWYFYKRTRGYTGPEVALDARDDIQHGVFGLSMKDEEEARKHAVHHHSNK